MVIHRHVYALTTGKFREGGYCVPVYDPATEAVAELPDSTPFPDYARQRWDAARKAVRDATPDELAADATAALEAEATAGSRKKDLLAICAMVLERFDPTWAGLTAAQKKTAVFAAADRWKFWREYAENNL